MSDVLVGPLLALDTSTDVGSVAVRVEGEVVARGRLEERGQHSARLSPLVGDTLAQAGVDFAELAAVVVGSGPGSFTGVRVAAATAKGLCHALAVPLIPMSSLAGIAMVADAGRERYVLLDARGDRIYGGGYRVEPGALQVTAAPHGGEIGSVLERPLPPTTTFVGDGAEQHRARLEAAGYRVADHAADRIADGLLAAIDAVAAAEVVADPRNWEPTYIRPFRPGAAAAG